MRRKHIKAAIFTATYLETTDRPQLAAVIYRLLAENARLRAVNAGAPKVPAPQDRAESTWQAAEALKAEDPSLTWKAIAERLGVSDRWLRKIRTDMAQPAA